MERMPRSGQQDGTPAVDRIILVLTLLAPGVPFPRLLFDQVIGVVCEEDEEAVANTLLILERSGDLSRACAPRLGSVIITERRLSARVPALLPLLVGSANADRRVCAARSRLLACMCEALAIWTRGYALTARSAFEQWLLGHLSYLAHHDDRALVPLVCVGARHDPVYVLRWMPVVLRTLREHAMAGSQPSIDVIEVLAEALHLCVLSRSAYEHSYLLTSGRNAS